MCRRGRPPGDLLVAGSKLILASSSPRRLDLLREAGYSFVVDPADIDERATPGGLPPGSLAEKLAVAKARAVAPRHPDDVILAADTIVALGDHPLGKPADAGEARRMLVILEGSTHLVITGVAVIWAKGDYLMSRRATSAVRMRRLTSTQIDAYVAGGQWQGKAGGYGLQDPDPFVERLSGSKSNVVGMPMELTKSMLSEVGVFPRQV